ncbi:adenosylmethionine--8-amino-7-oxononanoate transaminase [Ferviditalea candida]|uniref:Adenosylmethionine-8-amino-7-oxononanoate aminotransferase n=1 Tax=Ferviditalea candida TaxID=3108399 RepID=A0ABU5ZKB9_9BACL|nr:adenosylmethionine--8-amino-7-oxononanoate transaminase [Paenibacillaceae bacterium T2]
MDESSKRHLLDKDRQFVWHPFTQMKDYAEKDHLLIEKADGVFLYDADGNRYYDTISSWWVNVHGHGHPRIKRAIAGQLDSMDHVMFSGLTHPTGIELAEKLTEIVPAGLSHVFYSDNGSTAVEVAVKMSFQYWQQIGEKQKTKFVFLENSYHGDTIGAVSVGGVEMYHSLFKPLLFDAYRIPSPNVHIWPDQTEQGADACVKRALNEAEKLFREKHGEIAAVIVEPMIQAAGGMIIYPAEYLRRLRELCTRYRIHLIADEVAVGFGRTGRMFGCNHAGISPDLICLSKGLTAGVIPLAATLCTDEIYMAFYDDYETLKTFFHGHSFTGNPVAAAVALESLSIFNDERVLERVQETSAVLSERLRRLESHEHAGRIRSLGMVGAFDLLADKSSGRSFDSRERTGNKVYWEGLKEGLILRPLGDTIYFWLPLAVTSEQVIDITERTERVLHRMRL